MTRNDWSHRIPIYTYIRPILYASVNRSIDLYIYIRHAYNVYIIIATVGRRYIYTLIFLMRKKPLIML